MEAHSLDDFMDGGDANLPPAAASVAGAAVAAPIVVPAPHLRVGVEIEPDSPELPHDDDEPLGAQVEDSAEQLARDHEEDQESNVAEGIDPADLEQDLDGVLDADEADAEREAAAEAAAAAAAAAPAHAADDAAAEDEDDEDEDGEDEDDESDDEEEEEPKLKYQRLGASVTSILKSDAAKCLLAHEKFLVLGTAAGKLYVLDLNGNEIMSFAPHTAAINDLSLDCNGDYVASCSNDGTVVITNLFTKETTRHAYARSIKSVALPGLYKSNQMFAAGGVDSKFFINTKGWFSSKENLIHAGEGPIGAIKWRRELLAWANDAGVKVYDVNTSERITHIARTGAVSASGEDAGPPPPAELYKCHLCWAKDDTLLIGWADTVKVGVVKSRAGAVAASHRPAGSPMIAAAAGGGRYVQIVAMFRTEFMICGIAPWGGEHLVLMAFLEEEVDRAAAAAAQAKRVARAPSTDDASATGPASLTRGGARPSLASSSSSSSSAASALASPAVSSRPSNSQRPELRIVSYTNEEISSDALPIMGYQNYAASDYRLDYNPNGGGFAAPPMPSPSPSAQAAAGALPVLAGTVGVPTTGSGSGAGAGGSASAAAAAAAAASLEYLFYILAPSDIVVAKPRDYDDHIGWLLARQRYEEALHYAGSYAAHLKIHNLYDIGENFLQYLFETERNYGKAALYCTRLLGASKSLWETYVMLFVKHDKLAYIAEHIPVANPTLGEHIYELVLNQYITAGGPAGAGAGAAGAGERLAPDTPAPSSHHKLLSLVNSWSHHLYNIRNIIENCKSKLEEMRQEEDEAREWRDRENCKAAAQAAQAEGKVQERVASRAKDEEKSKILSESAVVAPAANKQRHAHGGLSSPLVLDPALFPPPPPMPPPRMLVLLETLGVLYLLNAQFGLAFDVYLKLQRPADLFKILSTYAPGSSGGGASGGGGLASGSGGGLFEQKFLEERCIPLMLCIARSQTLELLLAQVERIPVKEVMEQLRMAEIAHVKQMANAAQMAAAAAAVSAAPQSLPAASAAAPAVKSSYRSFQFLYLHQLFKKDHFLGVRFHDDQVLLYAQYSPRDSEHLLYFLRNSNGYTLERALEACESYGLYSEMVFLLKRMGNTQRALTLIIDQLHDVKEAINFVEENGGRADGSSSASGGGGGGSAGPVDNSLWEELITRSLNNPAFLSDLLEHVGSHYVDLSKLIVRIPDALPIPDLKAKLINILRDCALQQEVIKGCTNILKNDCKALVDRLDRRRRRAVKVPATARCAICEVDILGGSAVSASSSVIAGGGGGGVVSGSSGGGSSSSSSGSAVLVFFCRHVVHRVCADSQRSVSERRTEQQCPRCNAHGGHAPQSQASAASASGAQGGLKAKSAAAGGASGSLRSSAAAPSPTSRPMAVSSAFSAPRSILPQPAPSAAATTPSASGGPAAGRRVSASVAQQRVAPLPQPANVLPSVSAGSSGHSRTGSLSAAAGVTPSPSASKPSSSFGRAASTTARGRGESTSGK